MGRVLLNYAIQCSRLMCVEIAVGMYEKKKIIVVVMIWSGREKKMVIER